MGVSFGLAPQSKRWRCQITAWEYITGIDREDIARDIGHDGCVADPADTRPREVGAFSLELVWWAIKRGLSPVPLYAREYWEQHRTPSELERWHSAVHAPSQLGLLEFLQGRLAVVGLSAEPHVVAWLGTFAVDPAHGYRRELRPEHVGEATVLMGADTTERINALTARFAHAVWEHRGGRPGSAESDWLLAERLMLRW